MLEHPSLAPSTQKPLCSEQPRNETLYLSGPLGKHSLSVVPAGPRDLPETPMAVVGGQSLGLLLVMAEVSG